VLLLPVGKTAVPIYRELVRLHSAGRAPFRRAATFNLDELRVAPQDPRSFRSFMERHLFSKLERPLRRVDFLRGDAADPERECARYERELAREGPPDIALVGIGVNGHVAYLEPGTALVPRTSLVRLSAATRRDLAADGVRPVPREALTVGIETILSSREIVLVATGREKAAAVAVALEGPVTPRLPTSLLSLHPRLEVLLDRAAASLLADPGSKNLSE
jgi:glucosamine-6-phosphate deaminase